jgi:DNA-directed RNA polymerase beta subunit
MNVGQVFECLLGLAGEKLGNRFKVTRLMKFMEKKHHVYLSIKTERGCN